MNGLIKGVLVGAVVIVGAIAVTGFQGTTKIGNIDSSKILEESKPAKEAQDKFNKQAQSRDDLERYFNTYRCYAAKEREDLRKLWTKDRTKDEDTQFQQLKTLGENRQRRQAELSTKQPNLTPDETKELATLGEEASGMPDYLKALDQQLLEELNEMKKLSAPAVIKRIKEVIQKVAQEQGLSVVYDSQIAPYAQVDITDAVLKELNK